MGHTWTKPQDDDLTRYIVVEGHSYTQAAAMISASFGVALSRNAAIGRAARIGLAQPKKTPITLATAAPKPRRRHVKLPKAVPLPDIPSPAIEPEEPMAIDLPGEADTLITVLDLQAHHCRFPFGEGPFHFCGVRRREGFPYCAGHVAVTHNMDGRRG